VTVEVPPAPRLQLSGARPNPAVAPLVVAFALAGSEPARLDLRDIAGRGVLTREVGSLGAGAHVVNLAESRALPAPGLYFLRLSQGADVRTARVVVLR
jgi:hypothetical protein